MIRAVKKSVENISYKVKFVDSMRFMATSLTKRVDCLSEGTHRIKCKNCNCFLKYENVKNNLMKHKCLSCNKNYSEKFNEELKKKSENTLRFSNSDINKFIFVVKKGCLSL